MKVVDNLTYGTAISYYLAYKCLMEKNKELCIYYNDNISMYVFPAITTAALSCEIALKNLIYLDTGKKERGHNLEKLFKALNQDTQTRYICQTVELYNLRLKKLGEVTVFTDDDFRLQLFSNKDIYTKCRYLYEGTVPVDLDFLEAFMFSLNSTFEDYENFIMRLYA
nr:hypothetical protein [uncultured Aminipila sp.]